MSRENKKRLNNNKSSFSKRRHLNDVEMINKNWVFRLKQGIIFFDSNKKSTLSEKRNIPKDIDDAFYVYANMKRLNESEFEELKCLN